MKMEQLKKDITDLLNKSKEIAYYKGSCGELGDSFQAIDVDYFADIVNDIAKIVENNFEPKKCMPEGINSKEEHEEYLKAIGYEKYIKELEHFKENCFGLNATDKPIGDLLHMFWQRSSDACPLECGKAEKQELEFAEWVKTVSWVIS